MKLLLESLMVALGTMLAAALVALGEPASGEVQLLQAAHQSPQTVLAALLSTAD